MKGWIPALRIARREARKAKGRSALVLAMIGLPVALLAFAAASYDMFTLTVEEKLDRRMGSADALITWNTTGKVQQTPEGAQQYSSVSPSSALEGVNQDNLVALLPPGSRLVAIGNKQVKARTPNGIGYLHARIADVGDPLLRGMVHVLDGAAPSGPDQVAINSAAAQRLNVSLGGTITLLEPDRDLTVKAIVEYPSELDALVVLPADAEKLTGRQDNRAWLADTPAPIDWEMVKRLNEKGVVVASRAVILDPPPVEGLDLRQTNADAIAVGAIGVGLAIVEIILLAGPAFAVSARRRSRDLALIAAAGGEPKQLRRMVLADGVVLGLAGAIIGICLGIVAALAGRPLLEQGVSHARAGGYRFFPMALIGITVLAVGTGVVAATVPAFTAARQNVVQALAGRRGVVRSRKRWIAAGTVMIVIGVVASVLGAFNFEEGAILAGVVLCELGLVLLTPALLGLVARAGRWLPLAPRLALRDTARNRSSAAPAISAIMAAVAGAVAVGVLLHGQEKQQEAQYTQILPLGHIGIGYFANGTEPHWPSVEAAVREVLPDADIQLFSGTVCPQGAPADAHCGLNPVIPVERRCPYYRLGREPTEQVLNSDPRCQPGKPFSPFTGVVVGDGSAITAFTKADPAEVRTAREVLARGGVVVFDPRVVVDGKVTLAIHAQASTKAKVVEAPTITVEGYALRSGTRGAMTFVSTQVVELAKLRTKIEGLVAATPMMPSQAQEDRLRAALQSLGAESIMTVERGPGRDGDPIVLGLIAAAIALAAAGIATGLTAADSRADLGTLATVGASPTLRRLLSLCHAGLISGLGALLGTVTGLGVAGVVIFTLNRSSLDPFTHSWQPEMPFGVPWDTIMIVFAVPLLAMAGAGLITRSRLPIERRL